MACAVTGELKCKDGRTRRFAVEAENNLNSITAAVKQLSADISAVLTELVEEERSAGSACRGQRVSDEEVEDDDEDEDGEEDSSSETRVGKLQSEPPAKRVKSVAPS